jgi:hypothetical protein
MRRREQEASLFEIQAGMMKDLLLFVFKELQLANWKLFLVLLCQRMIIILS